ncbi:MAG: polyhydroxyalkanoic acid system family protein [Lysobacteraceae bacterium]
MAKIDIQREHDKSKTQARAAVNKVAEKIAEKFGISHKWSGDALDFEGSGVSGRIALGKKNVHLTATLGFLLSAFKGSIETEIQKYLDREFG